MVAKIDNSNSHRREYFTVKDIITPSLLILDNGIKIKLLGIKERVDKEIESLGFLREKVKGQKVFISFDSPKYDNEENLLCYLYLKNKTFINAHLIKYGLADVDSSIEYKYKLKFLGIHQKV